MFQQPPNFDDDLTTSAQNADDTQNSFFASILDPRTTSVPIPDGNTQPTVMRTINLDGSLTTVANTLHVFYWAPGNNGGKLLVGRRVADPFVAGKFIIGWEAVINPDEDISQNYIKSRLASALLQIKCNTVSAGTFELSGSLQAARFDSVPDFKNLDPNNITPINSKDAVTGISFFDGITALYLPHAHQPLQVQSNNNFFRNTGQGVRATFSATTSTGVFPFALDTVKTLGASLFDTASAGADVLPTYILRNVTVDTTVSVTNGAAATVGGSLRVDAIYVNLAGALVSTTAFITMPVLAIAQTVSVAGKVTIQSPFPIRNIRVTSNVTGSLTFTGMLVSIESDAVFGPTGEAPAMIVTLKRASANQVTQITSTMNFEAVPSFGVSTILNTTEDSDEPEEDLRQVYAARKRLDWFNVFYPTPQYDQLVSNISSISQREKLRHSTSSFGRWVKKAWKDTKKWGAPRAMRMLNRYADAVGFTTSMPPPFVAQPARPRIYRCSDTETWSIPEDSEPGETWAETQEQAATMFPGPFEMTGSYYELAPPEPEKDCKTEEVSKEVGVEQNETQEKPQETKAPKINRNLPKVKKCRVHKCSSSDPAAELEALLNGDGPADRVYAPAMAKIESGVEEIEVKTSETPTVLLNGENILDQIQQLNNSPKRILAHIRTFLAKGERAPAIKGMHVQFFIAVVNGKPEQVPLAMTFNPVGNLGVQYNQLGYVHVDSRISDPEYVRAIINKTESFPNRHVFITAVMSEDTTFVGRSLGASILLAALGFPDLLTTSGEVVSIESGRRGDVTFVDVADAKIKRNIVLDSPVPALIVSSLVDPVSKAFIARKFPTLQGYAKAVGVRTLGDVTLALTVASWLPAPDLADVDQELATLGVEPSTINQKVRQNLVLALRKLTKEGDQPKKEAVVQTFKDQSKPKVVPRNLLTFEQYRTPDMPVIAGITDNTELLARLRGHANGKFWQPRFQDSLDSVQGEYPSLAESRQLHANLQTIESAILRESRRLGNTAGSKAAPKGRTRAKQQIQDLLGDYDDE